MFIKVSANIVTITSLTPNQDERERSSQAGLTILAVTTLNSTLNFQCQQVVLEEIKTTCHMPEAKLANLDLRSGWRPPAIGTLVQRVMGIVSENLLVSKMKFRTSQTETLSMGSVQMNLFASIVFWKQWEVETSDCQKLKLPLNLLISYLLKTQSPEVKNSLDMAKDQ